MAMSKKNKGYPQEWEKGDLVEYIGSGYPSRNKFGIVISVKKIIGAYQLGVLFGVREVLIDSRRVEKR